MDPQPQLAAVEDAANEAVSRGWAALDDLADELADHIDAVGADDLAPGGAADCRQHKARLSFPDPYAPHPAGRTRPD